MLYHFSCAHVIEMATDTYLSAIQYYVNIWSVLRILYFVDVYEIEYSFPAKTSFIFKEKIMITVLLFTFEYYRCDWKCLNPLLLKLVDVSTVNQTRVHNKWCIHAKGDCKSLFKEISLKFALQLFIQFNIRRLCSHCSKFRFCSEAL